MPTLPTRHRIGDTGYVVSSLTGSGAALVVVALLTSSVRADVRATTEITVPSPSIEPDHAALDTPPPSETILDDRVQAGRHWRIDTARGAIHVWIPADYDAATAATVVFVHGYWIQIDEAWESYRLAQQFALSGLNAMFIGPEAPAAKWDPIAWPSLAELVRTVADHVEVAMPARRLVAVGHSGAYRTLASWLANPALDTVVMLDALYIEYGLLPWLRASRQHRLVNIVYETGRISEYLHRRLPSTRRVDGLPAARLPDARILYVKADVGHWQLVTDGVALPLALRAIEVPLVASAPLDLPLGLPPRREPPRGEEPEGPADPVLDPQVTEPAY
jgi:hypothetical protein